MGEGRENGRWETGPVGPVRGMRSEGQDSLHRGRRGASMQGEHHAVGVDAGCRAGKGNGCEERACVPGIGKRRPAVM